MRESDTDRNRRAELTREAARVYLSLREKPDDVAAQKARDAFLARGDAERRAFAAVSRVSMAVARYETRSARRKYSIGLLAGLAVTLALTYQELRVVALADFRTGSVPETMAIASGDFVTLDAASALIDDSNESERRVTLLDGAGFFDVDQDGRRFIVAAGRVEAEALGTRFEVSQLRDSVLIVVEKGLVEVRRDGKSSRLSEGEILVVRDNQQQDLRPRSNGSAATWRTDRLDLTGLRFGEVVSLMDRRLPARIVVVGRDLADAGLSGGLDISDPYAALELLAASQGAKIRLSTPFGILVTK